MSSGRFSYFYFLVSFFFSLYIIVFPLLFSVSVPPSFTFIAHLPNRLSHRWNEEQRKNAKLYHANPATSWSADKERKAEWKVIKGCKHIDEKKIKRNGERKVRGKTHYVDLNGYFCLFVYVDHLRRLIT